MRVKGDKVRNRDAECMKKSEQEIAGRWQSVVQVIRERPGRREGPSETKGSALCRARPSPLSSVLAPLPLPIGPTLVNYLYTLLDTNSSF